MGDSKKGFTVICNSCENKTQFPTVEDSIEEIAMLGDHSGNGSLHCGKCGEDYYD